MKKKTCFIILFSLLVAFVFPIKASAKEERNIYMLSSWNTVIVNQYYFDMSYSRDYDNLVYYLRNFFDRSTYTYFVVYVPGDTTSSGTYDDCMNIIFNFNSTVMFNVEPYATVLKSYESIDPNYESVGLIHFSTDIPIPTFTPQSTPIPTFNPNPTSIPTYTPVPNPTYTPVPNPTYTPVPNPTYTPVPNPTYTPVPRPTNTPVPHDVYLSAWVNLDGVDVDFSVITSNGWKQFNLSQYSNIELYDVTSYGVRLEGYNFNNSYLNYGVSSFDANSSLVFYFRTLPNNPPTPSPTPIPYSDYYMNLLNGGVVSFTMSPDVSAVYCLPLYLQMNSSVSVSLPSWLTLFGPNSVYYPVFRIQFASGNLSTTNRSITVMNYINGQRVTTFNGSINFKLEDYYPDNLYELTWGGVIPTTPTPSPIPTSTPVPTSTPLPIMPTNTPVPNPTNTPVPRPTNTPVPNPTNTPVPRPTNTPVPRPTNTPVPLPAQSTPIPTYNPNAPFNPSSDFNLGQGIGFGDLPNLFSDTRSLAYLFVTPFEYLFTLMWDRWYILFLFPIVAIISAFIWERRN